MIKNINVVTSKVLKMNTFFNNINATLLLHVACICTFDISGTPIVFFRGRGVVCSEDEHEEDVENEEKHKEGRSVYECGEGEEAKMVET